MKPSSPNNKTAFWRRVLANLVLLLFGLVLGLGVLELAFRIGNFDRRMGPRSYDVNGYEFQYHVALNSDYFRDEEFHRKKESGTFRIFLIGDSFVFGSGAGQDKFRAIA